MKLIKNLIRYNPSILQLKKPQECIIEKNIKDSFKAESKSHGFFDILYKYEKTDYIYNILHSRRKRLHGKSLLKWVYQTSHFQQNLVASDLNVTFFNSLKTAFTLNSRVYSVKRKLSKLYPLALFKLAYKRTRLMPSQSAFFMQSGKNLPFRNLLFSMRNTKKKPMLSVRNSFSLFRLFIKRLRRTIFLFFKSHLFLVKKMAFQRKSHRRPRRRKIGYIRYRTMGFIFKKIGFKKKLLKPFAKLTKKKKKRFKFFSFHYRKKDFRIFPNYRWKNKRKRYGKKARHRFNQHKFGTKTKKIFSIKKVVPIIAAAQEAQPTGSYYEESSPMLDDLAFYIKEAVPSTKDYDVDTMIQFTNIIHRNMENCQSFHDIAWSLKVEGFLTVSKETICIIAIKFAEKWPEVHHCFDIDQNTFDYHLAHEMQDVSQLQLQRALNPLNDILASENSDFENSDSENSDSDNSDSDNSDSDQEENDEQPTSDTAPKDQYYTIKVDEPTPPNPNAGGFEFDPTKWSYYTWAGIGFVVILVGYYAYVTYYDEKESSEMKKLSTQGEVTSKEDWSNVNASVYEEQETILPAGIGTACTFLLVTLAKLFPYVISSWYLGRLGIRYILGKA